MDKILFSCASHVAFSHNALCSIPNVRNDIHNYADLCTENRWCHPQANHSMRNAIDRISRAFAGLSTLSTPPTDTNTNYLYIYYNRR